LGRAWVLGDDVRIWLPSHVNVVALFYKDMTRFARALEKKSFKNMSKFTTLNHIVYDE
jgi:hypothetical protein